jgi:hypothetical protein
MVKAFTTAAASCRIGFYYCTGFGVSSTLPWQHRRWHSAWQTKPGHRVGDKKLNLKHVKKWSLKSQCIRRRLILMELRRCPRICKKVAKNHFRKFTEIDHLVQQRTILFFRRWKGLPTKRPPPDHAPLLRHYLQHMPVEELAWWQELVRQITIRRIGNHQIMCHALGLPKKRPPPDYAPCLRHYLQHMPVEELAWWHEQLKRLANAPRLLLAALGRTMHYEHGIYLPDAEVDLGCSLSIFMVRWVLAC